MFSDRCQASEKDYSRRAQELPYYFLVELPYYFLVELPSYYFLVKKTILSRLRSLQSNKNTGTSSIMRFFLSAEE